MLKKPPDFGPTRRIEEAYARGLRKIAGRVLKPKRPEETFDQWIARLAARSQEPEIQTASEFLARQMFAWSNKVNARTWKEAASRSQHGATIHRLLQAELAGRQGAAVRALVRENARLISSLPVTAAQTLNREIMERQQRGQRPEAIAKFMRGRYPHLLSSRVRLIARTETAKASTALTQARCDDLNIGWYLWRTSEDSRVRKSHRNLDGVLIPWAHAPSPEQLVGEKPYGHYHSGTTFNCRCTQIVLLAADDVTWPRRVYWNGQVRQMRRDEFMKLNGAPEVRKAA